MVKDQQMMQPQQDPVLPASASRSPTSLDDLNFFFFFAISSSVLTAYCRMARCTMVGGAGASGKFNDDRTSSSCKILPRCRIRRYEGAGGRSSCHSDGHAFHTSSLTRPILISVSNDMVLRRPETSRKVRGVCGVEGTAVAALAALSVTVIGVDWGFRCSGRATGGWESLMRARRVLLAGLKRSCVSGEGLGFYSK